MAALVGLLIHRLGSDLATYLAKKNRGGKSFTALGKKFEREKLEGHLVASSVRNLLADLVA